MHYIKQAHAIAPHEPAVLHELGVLHYASGEYAEAADYFTRGDYDDAAREPSIFNLGHACRKMRRFDEAIEWYRLALAIAPRNASTYAALGFTHHLRGDPDGAIELYHQSLSLKPDDTFTCEMLKEALKDGGAASPLPKLAAGATPAVYGDGALSTPRRWERGENAL
ncbi:hypothetical protein EMIHUDRAFT_214582 [Emiliania huxleyi CCMP1516]|uniref:Tetratricopeptide repeat protein n=2 Tax=Emiliania huxleyi TaxID=2903 RepID=A0A0D3IJ61_EMIH1|nr:hypothetical protein EMIHUDRAFT_214582 [Emiliania huxleyi CCMP1516]EOD11296.1 hypothetical protein EMIHUDRAFT_214582 [Emiliania huxleyi CCMP1516]|eukprot:XP_005763725.1 hypothetical protein EMIHUDRAFT_214582 [Emiliania huxleyi CCMP1516]